MKGDMLTRSFLVGRAEGYKTCAETICKKGSPDEQFYVGGRSAFREILDKFFWNHHRGCMCEHPNELEFLAEAVMVMRERQTHPERTTPEDTAKAERDVDEMLSAYPEIREFISKMPWLYGIHSKDTEEGLEF